VSAQEADDDDKQAKGKLNDDMGVAVVFDEDEEVRSAVSRRCVLLRCMSVYTRVPCVAG
jgi:hypothetical protein